MQLLFPGKTPSRKHPVFVSGLLILYFIFQRAIFTNTAGRIIALILLMAPLACLAQTAAEFNHLTLEHGLSNHWVRCIMKDSRGFMWFGTANGLNRYDGIEFRIFKKANDNRSLSNNTINTILEDKKGNLWIGTQNGLNVFDRKTETFHSFKHDPKDTNSLGSVSISKVLEDSNGNIWIGTSNGLDLYLPEKQIFKHFRNNPGDSNSLSNNIINDIEIDSNGNIWIATRTGGVNLFEVRKNKFTRFIDKKGTGELSINVAIELHRDEKGNIWMGAVTGGLYVFNQQTSSFERVHYYIPASPDSADDYVTGITNDNEGRLFIGTDKAVYMSDPTKKHFTKYASFLDNIGGMSGTSTRSIFYDHQSNILWVGTEAGGLNYTSKWKKPFQHFICDQKGVNRWPIFSMVEEDDNTIWMATFGGGIMLIDQKTGKTEPYLPLNLKSQSKVTVLRKDDAGNIWIGNYNAGLYMFESKTKKLIEHINRAIDSNSIDGTHIYDLLIDKDRKFWLATDKALNLFNPLTKGLTSYKPIITDPENDRNNFIRQVIEYDNDNLLVLSIKSLQLFNKRQNRFFKFMEALHKKTDDMQCVFIDSKKNLWIGTNNGLFRVNKDRSSFRAFSEKDGLPSSDISTVIEDDKGNLWISTKTNGLFKFTNAMELNKSPDVLLYSVDDGLQGRYYVSRSVYKGKNHLYFGGQNGMNMFNPGEVLGNLQAPPVVITKLKIFNKEVAVGDGSPLKSSITETRSITLSYKDNVFSLSFAALNFLSPHKNQYKYILENFEKDWNYVSNTTTATYTNLNPGVYTFRVKASDNYGVWNDVGTSLRIVVTPPFWKTWWFLTTVALFLTGSLIGFYKMRLGSMRRQKIKLEKLVQDRTESLVKLTEEEKLARQEAEKLRAEADKANQAKSVFLATMSHEIRTPLNGVIGCTALLSETRLTEEQQKYTHMIRSSGENLLAVINDILDFSKIESGKMELDEHPFNLRDCIEDVLELFAGKASSSGLDLIYQIATNVPTALVGDRIRLKQVLINLIGNAFKFTQKGEVFINISLLEKTGSNAEILFEVRDTGIGIPEDKIDRLFKSFSQVDSSTTRKYGGTGLGLAISKLLVELMSGTIGVSSIENKGTTFHFNIKTAIDQNPRNVSSPDNISILEGKRILVVDDNETNRIILEAQLLQWKMVPTLCVSAIDALEKLSHKSSYDLIITDMQMPIMDGEQFAIKVKQSHPEALIILFTSVGADAKQYRDLFCTRLSKPVRQRELLQAILKVFSKDYVQMPQPANATKLSNAFAENYPLCILIAEDNKINQMLVTMTLKKLGYEPALAENGAIALEMLTEKEYDMVLMDVQMPVMDGLEATRLIRSTLQHQPCIIATTANAMKEDKDQCLKAGMDDYLSKPIQLHELVKLLQKWKAHPKAQNGVRS